MPFLYYFECEKCKWHVNLPFPDHNSTKKPKCPNCKSIKNVVVLNRSVIKSTDGNESESLKKFKHLTEPLKIDPKKRPRRPEGFQSEEVS